ncbi:MAG: Short-chain dehydrogenase/reductase [Pedosphaera sp.]|nr:Short-chain dehydrogenase/reductase [Pedosphaera sp.]
MPLALDLKGKCALVTGASDGVGAGVARMLARAGCDVVGTGQVAAAHERAQNFLHGIEAEGQRAFYLAGDVSEVTTPTRWVAEAVAVLGGLDIVVSNAGRNAFHGVNNCTEEQWEHNLNLNLASHWRLARASHPHLEQATPGVFLVMTSNHAYRTIRGCFPYNVTKTALTGLVRALAIEWGPSIRVVGIAPGFIDTPGNQRWFDSFPDPAVERECTERRHPVGRLGQPEEIGALCAFLASPHAGFISGTTILADGGREALLQDE